MHAEIGDQRRRSHVVGLALTEQRCAKPGTCQFHDIETRRRQRDADDFERFGSAGLRDRNRLTLILGREYRPRVSVELDRPAIFLLVIFAFDTLAGFDATEPVDDLHFVARIDARKLSRDGAVSRRRLRTTQGADAGRDGGFHIAHGHGQQRRRLVGQSRFEDAERRGELRKRWILVGLDSQRERTRIGQRTTSVVLKAGRQFDSERVVLGQPGPEVHTFDSVDRSVTAVTLRQLGCVRPAADVDQADPGSVARSDRRRKAKGQRQDRHALRVLVHALA